MKTEMEEYVDFETAMKVGMLTIIDFYMSIDSIRAKYPDFLKNVTIKKPDDVLKAYYNMTPRDHIIFEENSIILK